MTRWIESGSPASPVWLIGEAPGHQEIAEGRPLCGPSGHELDRMLAEAGWPPSASGAGFFRSNICHERPPSYTHRGKLVHNDIDQFFAGKQAAARESLSPLNGRYPRQPILTGLARLSSLARQHTPRVIIALGGSPLWGLTGQEGITKWRGSTLASGEDFACTKVLATLHPAIIADPSKGQYTYRPLIVQDLRRALREADHREIRKPAWDFCTAPTISDIKDWLTPLIERGEPLVADTEGWGTVDCIGFASSASQALCIPFASGPAATQHYWNSAEDEAQAFALVHNALTRCPITFHNAIWDMQVIGRNWGYLPLLHDDTMVAQHCAFPGLLGG
jgi:DNA polymerase